MTTKLTIKIAVFRYDLTLVAKYVFSQALSHLKIRLAGSEGDFTTGQFGYFNFFYTESFSGRNSKKTPCVCVN